MMSSSGAGNRRASRVVGRLLVALSLCAPLVPSVALGQPAAADAQRARFAEAQALFDAGEIEPALVAFRALAEETNSPNAHLYVARSLRALGRDPEAYDAMRVTVREATARAAEEPKYVATRDAAIAELALLALRVGHVVVALADAPGDATVTLDGAPLPPERLGSPITVEPGEHAVTVAVPGARPTRRTVTVAASETKTIALAVGSADEPPPVAPTRPPERGASTGGGVRIAGLVVGGVGLAALGTGVVTGLLSDADFASLEDTCGTSRCTDPGAADTIDRGKTLETISTVGFIGGAVLVAAAIPMVIWGGASDGTGDSALTLSPRGVALRTRF